MQIRLRHNTRLLATLVCIFAVWLSGGAAAAEFPLQASADGRHLVDHAGKPFLVLGDTARSQIAQLSEADIAHYLDDRARRGFNAIIVNLLEHKFASRAPSDPPGSSRPGGRWFRCTRYPRS